MRVARGMGQGEWRQRGSRKLAKVKRQSSGATPCGTAAPPCQLPGWQYNGEDVEAGKSQEGLSDTGDEGIREDPGHGQPQSVFPESNDPSPMGTRRPDTHHTEAQSCSPACHSGLETLWLFSTGNLKPKHCCFHSPIKTSPGSFHPRR